MAKKGVAHASPPKAFHLPADLRALRTDTPVATHIRNYVRAVNSGQVRTPGF